MNTTPQLTHSTALEHGRTVTVQAVWILAFAAATSVAAQVEIPNRPVPYTLQTLVVLLAGAFLGPRNGAISQLAYLVAGVLGAPVFSGGSFGIARLVGPTGGYLLAFPAAAAIVGYLITVRKSAFWSLLAMASGLLIIFASGTVQLYAVYFHDWSAAFKGGFLMFSWWDLVKLFAASAIYHETSKRWARLPR